MTRHLHYTIPVSPVLFIGIIAFLLSALLHFLAWKLFPRLHLLDHPEKYGLARPPLPYPTGLASVLTFLALFIATQDLDLQARGLILCIGVLAIVTFLDDLRGLPPGLRLALQILIGFLLFATGTRIYTITNPLGGILKLDSIDIGPQFSMFNVQFSNPLGPLPLWSGIFTILWILLTTNAFNWFDGIPGQVSVLAIIGNLTIGFLALSSRVGQPEIALMAFILAGCALGSALFDLPPNRVVMGDTGAMFFGLLLGTLSIYAGGKVATAFLVLGVPLMDALFVVARRILRRESPFSGNQDHLHHRLLRKGWSERQIILLTATLGSAFGITALFLETSEKFLAAIFLLLLMLGLTRYSRGSCPSCSDSPHSREAAPSQ